MIPLALRARRKANGANSSSVWRDEDFARLHRAPCANMPASRSAQRNYSRGDSSTVESCDIGHIEFYIFPLGNQNIASAKNAVL